MSDLANFILNAFRQEEAIVDPPAYGVHEVLLPEKAARHWGVPPFLRLTFDDTSLPQSLLDQDTEEIVHLGYGHSLVETLAQEWRDRLACAVAHINNIRLDKRGLAQLARQSVGLPNARLTALPRQIERPALSHYILFNFKASLLTDEKRERLVPVMMDLQAGHAVADRAKLQALMLLEDRSDFEELPPAPARWMSTRPTDNPLAEPVLSALLERATRAALDEMAAPLERLQRRTARHLELARARLTEYYDGLAHDLDRRITRTGDDERRGRLQDRLKTLQIERGAKLADIEAKYHLRIELVLVNTMVITQPKMHLAVQIGDRHTKIERTVVWDPLLHQLEPPVCDVCGRPGKRLSLCAGGHLAHEECLHAEQCIDCKRLYCRLCAGQMNHCAVCGRPVCQHSLNRCDDCGRGTCRQHVGLCHAVDGQPASLVETKAQPPPPVEKKEPKAPPEPPEPPREKQRLSSARRQAAERARQQSRQQHRETRRGVTGQRIDIYIHPEKPLIDAFVLGKGQKEIAVRTWQLEEEGIAIWCRCEKERLCRANGKLLAPEQARGISGQIKELAGSLAQEYGVSTRRIQWHAVTRGEMRRQTGPVLWGDWKNEEKLALARVGYDVTYFLQFRWNSDIDLPNFVRQIEISDAIQVGCITRLAKGLLHYEGVLPHDELLARVVELAHPGEWYTPQRGAEILRANSALRPPAKTGLVSLKDTARPTTLMKRKRKLGLPPRDFTLLELLNASDPKAPLPKEIIRIGQKLNHIIGQEVDLHQLQVDIKNKSSLESLLEALAGQYQVPEKRAADWLKWLTRLWEQTPRYELGGRTSSEADKTR